MAKLTVEECDFQGKHRAYNIQRIKMSTLSRAQYSQLKTAYRGKYASSVDAISIADLHALVKQYDKEFKLNKIGEYVENQIEKGNRVIDYKKEKRTNLSVIAQLTRLGNITESSLKNSLSEFRKKVNIFVKKEI